MIGYISLFEAISCFHSVIWAVSPMEYIDYFGLEYVFKYMVFMGNGEGYESSWYALCTLNQILGYQFFQVLSLGMNMSLCIDLVLTLRQPFYPAKRRLKFYLLFSFCLSLLVVLSAIKRGEETCLAPTNAAASNTQNIVLAYMLSLYILISLYSIIYAARMLSRPGISSEIRQIFMKKHVMYAVSFIIIWSLILLNAYDNLYNPPDHKKKPDPVLSNDEDFEYTLQYVRFPMGYYSQVWVYKDGGKQYMSLTPLQVISFISSMSTGMVMGIIRCFEPYFHFLLKKTIKAFYGVPMSEEQIDKKNNKLTDTIAAFLNSSLNIELVHIILKAITQECTKTEIIGDNWQSMVPLDSDFDEKKKYTLNEIEIKDPKKWKLIDVPVDVYRFNLNVLGQRVEEKETLIINEDIRVDELAPKIFAIIRHKEKINNDIIRHSLSPELNRDMVFKAGEGQGKSGSFFFFSHDRKFIIKTMNNEEYRTFMNIFKKYFRYILSNESSLIARIYGVFTVHKEKLQPVHLILMGNTVNLHGKGEGLKYMFDLKGSLINRESKMAKVHKPSSTLKDVNLLDIKKNENIIKFSPQDAQKIMDTIKRDVPILEEGNIMDYSLLLAIEENPNFRRHAATVRKLSKQSSNSSLSEKRAGESPNSDNVNRINLSSPGFASPHKNFEKTRHMFLSSNLQYIYHLAIIDYLQDYNFDKKSEHFAKTIWRGRKAEISAVPPERYSKRYIEFMENQVIIVDKKYANSSDNTDKMPAIREEDNAEDEIDW